MCSRLLRCEEDTDEGEDRQPEGHVDDGGQRSEQERQPEPDVRERVERRRDRPESPVRRDGGGGPDAQPGLLLVGGHRIRSPTPPTLPAPSTADLYHPPPNSGLLSIQG